MILGKTSLRLVVEHRLPLYSSCVQLLAVEPTIGDDFSLYKSTQMLTVIDPLRDRLSLEKSLTPPFYPKTKLQSCHPKVQYLIVDIEVLSNV